MTRHAGQSDFIKASERSPLELLALLQDSVFSGCVAFRCMVRKRYPRAAYSRLFRDPGPIHLQTA